MEETTGEWGAEGAAERLRLLKVPKGSLESVQKEGVAASTGAWVLQRSVEDLWRRCGAFKAFEGAKKQFRNPRQRNCGHGRCQKAVVLEQDTAATDGAKKQLRTGTVWLLGRGLKVGRLSLKALPRV